MVVRYLTTSSSLVPVNVLALGCLGPVVTHLLQPSFGSHERNCFCPFETLEILQLSQESTNILGFEIGT